MSGELSVLVLTRYGRKGASSRYRSLQYGPVLERQGIRCTYRPLFDDSYLDRRYAGRRGLGRIFSGALGRVRDLVLAGRYDLMVIEKELFPYFPAIGERILSRAGVPYVVDYDDAVFHAYDQHRRSLVRKLFGDKIRTVMSKARCVVAGNEYLADYARGAGASKVAVVPTVIDLDRYDTRRAAPKNGAPFTIGWIGSPFSARYLQEVAPALATMCVGGKARVVLVGAGDVNLRDVPFEIWPWSGETEVRDMQSFDVGIMPLPNEPWARGKCGFKLIQYMACGLPVVASPVGVNREIVEPGTNGELALSQDDWVEALTALRDQPERAEQMGARGRQKVEAHYSLQAVSPKVAGILRSAAQ